MVGRNSEICALFSSNPVRGGGQEVRGGAGGLPLKLHNGIRPAKWAKTEVTMRFLVENYPKKVIYRTFCDPHVSYLHQANYA